jgi:hypothetical protein
MEPCCALKYYPDIELCVNEMYGEEKSKEKQQRREKEENFGDSTAGKTDSRYLDNLALKNRK